MCNVSVIHVSVTCISILILLKEDFTIYTFPRMDAFVLFCQNAYCYSQKTFPHQRVS